MARTSDDGPPIPEGQPSLTEIDVNRFCISLLDWDGVHLDGSEAELPELEARLAIGTRRRAQRAVEPVRPGVVRALQRLAPARAGREHVTAVPAHIHERTQPAVSRACNNNRDLAGGAGKERALLGNLAGMADVLPAAGEDALAFPAQHLRVGVPGPRERPLHGLEL